MELLGIAEIPDTDRLAKTRQLLLTNSLRLSLRMLVIDPRPYLATFCRAFGNDLEGKIDSDAAAILVGRISDAETTAS